MSGIEIKIDPQRLLQDEVKRLRLENRDLKARFQLLDTWARTFGHDLCPGPSYADSYGEGMRVAKERVARILRVRVATAPKAQLEQCLVCEGTGIEKFAGIGAEVEGQCLACRGSGSRLVTKG